MLNWNVTKMTLAYIDFFSFFKPDSNFCINIRLVDLKYRFWVYLNWPKTEAICPQFC